MQCIATPDLFVSTSDFFAHATHALFIGPASTLVFALPTSLRFTLASNALRVAASNLFIATAHFFVAAPNLIVVPIVPISVAISIAAIIAIFTILSFVAPFFAIALPPVRDPLLFIVPTTAVLVRPVGIPFPVASVLVGKALQLLSRYLFENGPDDRLGSPGNLG